MAEALSPEAREPLLAAGWVPGRRVDAGEAVDALRAAGFRVPESALGFLSEFAFLDLEHEPSIVLNGEKVFTRTRFDPRAVATPRDAGVAARCETVAGVSLCPVGTDGFHLTLYLTDDGRFFAGVDSSVYVYAESAEELFQAMRRGDRPRSIGEWELD